MSGYEFEVAVRTLTASALAVSPEELQGDTALADLNLDDRTAAQLIDAIESGLEARFPDDFLDGIDTFGQFRSAIRLALIA